MSIRRYQKAHLCKHINYTLNVLVFVKDSCPVHKNRYPNVDYVMKQNCRECEYFEAKEAKADEV